MLNPSIHKAHLSIYPGEYVPLFEKADVNQKDKRLSGIPEQGTMETIEELEHCYRIEMSLPGVTREDFLVETFDNTLSVILFPRATKHNAQNGVLSTEAASIQPSVHEVMLPGDADLLFVSARYKEGVLSIYVPKSKYPGRSLNTQIAVY